MKLKYNDKKDTFVITGLTYDHLELLSTLLNHVRLGVNEEAFEFVQLFEDAMVPGSLELNVAKGETGKYVKDPIIEVS